MHSETLTRAVRAPREPEPAVRGGHETRKLEASVRRPGRISLQVIGGPDQGKQVTVDVQATGRVKGGRYAVNDLVLSDASVSGTHFELDLRPDGVLLRDLDSTNGVVVAGLRVREGWIVPNTSFRVGQSTIQLTAADAIDVPLSQHDRFQELFGRSVAMRQLFATLERVARKGDKLRMLIGGETGTGKELVARALHDSSSRRGKPFIVQDCSTIPRELAESTLFGHVRGAFTGAEARLGCFEEASGGTLFLDEIGELPLELQAKLLRVLQEERVVRVGEAVARKIDVRVICATHRDLRKMVGEDAFRQDLFFRIADMRVELPSLRDRGDDVLLLAELFLQRRAATGDAARYLTPDACTALRGHTWPGNVRELRSVIDRAFVMADGPAIDRADLDLTPAEASRRGTVDDNLLRLAHDDAIEAFERRYFTDLLAQHATKVKAARAAGMTTEGLRLAIRRLKLRE